MKHNHQLKHRLLYKNLKLQHYKKILIKNNQFR